MIRAATALLAGALLAAAGCGGDDKQQIEQTVKEFVTAIRTGDADKFCDELVTREFIEQRTFAKGDNAREDCKRQLKQIKDLRLKLVRIAGIRVDGDRARVKLVLSVQGQPQDQLYRMKKEDGDWLIASGSGA